MPFTNPIVAGTTLIRESIKSPDYVAGVSGWSINRDGTAEFNDVTLRGTLIINGPNGSQIRGEVNNSGSAAFFFTPPTAPSQTWIDAALVEGITEWASPSGFYTPWIRIESPNENGQAWGYTEWSGGDVVDTNARITDECDYRIIRCGNLLIQNSDFLSTADPEVLIEGRLRWGDPGATTFGTRVVAYTTSRTASAGLTGLTTVDTLTAPVVSGRVYRARWHGAISSSAAGDTVQYGLTVGGTVMDLGRVTCDRNIDAWPFTAETIFTASSTGNITINGTLIRAAGTGTITRNAGTGAAQAIMTLEEIG